MINKILISFSIVLLVTSFSSCDKYEKAKKQLAGTWQLTSYRFKNQQSLSYFPESSGTLFFENCGDTVCAYSIALTYSSPQITGTRNESGKYSINEDGGMMYFVPIVNGAEQSRISNRVTLHTKTNLEFQYTDSLGRSHHFVFQK